MKDAGLINMHRVGTMNYYYVDANESCWRGLKALVDRVDDIVEQAAKAGYPVWEDNEE